MGTWADSFLPAITGELAQVGPAMQQGQLQGMNAARQLALLDMQIKQQQMQNQAAERAMQQPQGLKFHSLGGGAYAQTDAAGNVIKTDRPPQAMSPEMQMLGMFSDPRGRTMLNDYFSAKRGPEPPLVVPPGSTVLPQGGRNQPPPTQSQDPSQAWRASVPAALAGPSQQPAAQGGMLPYTAPSRPQNLNPTEQVLQKVATSGVPSLNAGERAIWDMHVQKNTPAQKGTPGQIAVDQAFGKDYAEYVAAGGFADVQKNLNQLRASSSTLAKRSDLTGPYIGMIPDKMRKLTETGRDAMQVRDAILEVVQRNLRLILGPQFTEKEGIALMARAYDPQQLPAENNKRVKRLITQIESAAKAKQQAVEYYEKNGTLVGWKGKLPSIADLNPDVADVDEGRTTPVANKPMKQGSAIRFSQLTKQGKTKQEAFQIMAREGY